MKTEIKQKIAFAMIMGIVTTGTISFTLIGYGFGFNHQFITRWLSSWLLAYILVVPIILIVGPKVQNIVYRLVGGN
jgi:hypothetical protein